MSELVSTYPFFFGPVFLVLVILLGILMVWVVETSRLAPFFQSTSGIVAPFGSVPALLFGLIVAFTGQEIWSNHLRAEAAVAREADAIRVVRGVAASLGERGAQLDRLTVSYANIATAGDWRSPQQASATSTAIHRMLDHGLFGAVAQENAQIQRTVLELVSEIRASYRERLVAGHSTTTRMKWIGAFILGVLTQAGIVLVHMGKPRSSRMAIGVFSICMAFVLWTAYVRLDVFNGRYGVALDPVLAAAGVTR